MLGALAKQSLSDLDKNGYLPLKAMGFAQDNGPQRLETRFDDYRHLASLFPTIIAQFPASAHGGFETALDYILPQLTQVNKTLYNAFAKEEGKIGVIGDVGPTMRYDMGPPDRPVIYHLILPIQQKQILSQLFERNFIAHELGHFMDQVFTPDKGPKPYHSAGNIFKACFELDKRLHSDGVASIIEKTMEESGYNRETLTKKARQIGVPGAKIDDYIRYHQDCERFALTVEFYFGSAQSPSLRSPILEAYVDHIVGVDIGIKYQSGDFFAKNKKKQELVNFLTPHEIDFLNKTGMILKNPQQPEGEAEVVRLVEEIGDSLSKAIGVASVKRDTGRQKM